MSVILVLSVLLVGLTSPGWHLGPDENEDLENDSAVTDDLKTESGSEDGSITSEGESDEPPYQLNPDDLPKTSGETECPTERRYKNHYTPETKPEWQAADEVSPESSNYTTHEVTRYPYCDPTVEQLESAWELYDETFEAAVDNDWFDLQEGLDDGYTEYGGRHYLRADLLFNEDTLVPEEPEYLVYLDHPEKDSEKVLAGVMFKEFGYEGDQIGGPLTVWHYHPIEKFEPQRPGVASLLSEETGYDSFEDIYESEFGDGDGVLKYRSLDMLHVWFVEHPEGPFGTTMGVPQEHLEEPSRMNETEFKERVLYKYEENYRAEQVAE